MSDEYPSVPLGALGFASPRPRPPPPRPPRPKGPKTRGRDGKLAPILGGEPVRRQVEALLRAEVARGRHLLRVADEWARGRSVWNRYERSIDGDCLETFALAFPPREDEPDEDYVERLTDGALLLRGPVDARVKRLLLSPGTRHARSENGRNATTVTEERRNESNASTVTQERLKRTPLPPLPERPTEKSSSTAWRRYAVALEEALHAEP